MPECSEDLREWIDMIFILIFTPEPWTATKETDGWLLFCLPQTNPGTTREYSQFEVMEWWSKPTNQTVSMIQRCRLARRPSMASLHLP